MQGVVTDAATHKPIPMVSVINTRTQQSAYTGDNGLYTIAANTGDVIVFQYLGYKEVQKIKPLSVIVATQDISMTAVSYNLNEYTFRLGHWTQYQLDSMDRKSTYKMVLNRQHPSPIASPASAIADLFSKKSQQIYRFQREFPKLEMQRFIDTRYTAELVTQVTGVSGDTVGHFMYAYPIPYDYARAATDLELKMWIRNNFKQWIPTYKEDTLLQEKTDSIMSSVARQDLEVKADSTQLR